MSTSSRLFKDAIREVVHADQNGAANYEDMDEDNSSSESSARAGDDTGQSSLNREEIGTGERLMESDSNRSCSSEDSLLHNGSAEDTPGQLTECDQHRSHEGQCVNERMEANCNDSHSRESLVALQANDVSSSEVNGEVSCHGVRLNACRETRVESKRSADQECEGRASGLLRSNRVYRVTQQRATERGKWEMSLSSCYARKESVPHRALRLLNVTLRCWDNVASSLAR